MGIETNGVTHETTCLGCSLLCEDVVVSIYDQTIEQVHTECHVAQEWFARETTVSNRRCSVNGQPADLDKALQATRKLIRESRSPMIFGLADQSVQTHRAAIDLAKQINSVIDWTSGCAATANQLALQQCGNISCTLGEIPARADLVITWFCDPQTTHPRFFSKYAEDYTAVCQNEQATAAGTTKRFQIQSVSPGQLARTLANRIAKPATETSVESRAMRPGRLRVAAHQKHDDDETIYELARRIGSATYCVFVVDDNLADKFGQTAVLSLSRLVRQICNSGRHGRLVQLRSPANTLGIENTLAWLTGYPMALQFRDGRAMYSPHEFTLEYLVDRDWIDLLILIGDSRQLSSSVQSHLNFESLKKVVLVAGDDPIECSSDVEFRTSRLGLDESGTAFRTDGVPIEVGKILETDLPSAGDLLRSLSERISG